MPPERASIHATAVAIDRRALLILGAARCGKSSLAWEIVVASPKRAMLIADDRVLLTRRGDITLARPHPRIAGFIERRGVGFVALPWIAQAPVAAWVDLDGLSVAAGHRGDGQAVTTLLRDHPRLDLAEHGRVGRCRRVLRWWDCDVRPRSRGTPSPGRVGAGSWSAPARDATYPRGTLELED